jgi:serine/threonine-protein kinase HipA
MSRKLNVYLCGKKIGALIEDDLSQLSFRYDDDSAVPLSVRLPVRAQEYPHALAYPFFENLTPEGDAFEILTKDHAAGNKTFSILDKFGGDCAGAVAFYETEPDCEKNETLYEISPEEVARIIDNLPEDPLLTGLANPPRLSLAGAQSKFAVHKFNGKYYSSDDEHPTTHIVKIINRRFPNLLENELFCMRLAKAMRLNVPKLELLETAGRQFLEIERYDRLVENGTVRRVHQEDFCQALGIVSDKKYQTDGGAKLKDCYGVIDKHSSNHLADAMQFIEWITFNYLIGNTDSHAKNLSLLHTNSGIRLAPFYDLLSTEVYSEKLVDHTMAMLVNGKGRYDSLKPNDFAALYENLGLNAINTTKIIKDKFENIIPSAEQLRESIGASRQLDSAVYDDIIAIIKKRFIVL